MYNIKVDISNKTLRILKKKKSNIFKKLTLKAKIFKFYLKNYVKI
jgi:hypothetical protein